VVTLLIKSKMPPYKPPVDSFYSEVPIPEYINPYKIIGHRGNILINITYETGCQYIWIDFKRKVVEIWGREDSLPRAIARIRRLIHKILAKTIRVPDEYYELPMTVRDQLSVYTWKKTGLDKYEILGKPKLCMMFLDLIKPKYTSITTVEQKPSGIIVDCI